MHMKHGNRPFFSFAIAAIHAKQNSIPIFSVLPACSSIKRNYSAGLVIWAGKKCGAARFLILSLKCRILIIDFTVVGYGGEFFKRANITYEIFPS
jgi:hypothetical protein